MNQYSKVIAPEDADSFTSWHRLNQAAEPEPEEEPEDLSALFAPAPTSPVAPPTPSHIDEPIDLKQHMADTERALIISALEQTGWVNAHAAKLLTLQRTTLVEKMRKYNISQETDSSEFRQAVSE